MDRKDYVAALRRERQHVQERYGAEGNARQAQIDVELARYDDEPQIRVRETAVPGPISRARASAKRKN